MLFNSLLPFLSRLVLLIVLVLGGVGDVGAADLGVSGAAERVELSCESLEEVRAWEKLKSFSGTTAWTKKSIPLLQKMSDKSDEVIEQVRRYYSTHQKPSGTPSPPFTHQGTPFDDFGHPDFVPEIPVMAGGHGKIKYVPENIPNQPELVGTSTDMTKANTWAKNTFNQNGLNFKEHPTVSGRCLIKDPNSPFADANGWVDCVWHHHQDAKTMLPVPVSTHNRSFPTGSPHTGGGSILRNPELSDLVGFFDSPSL